MADQLVTTAQVKARIGISDANDDALLSELIDQVSGWIEGYTGRKLVPEVAATYVFDTLDGYVLRIPRGIRTITSIGVASTVHQPDSAGTYTNVPVADVLLRPKPADLPVGWPPTEVRFSRGTLAGTVKKFGRIDNGCTITGDFGFAATPVDLQAAAIDAVVTAYATRKTGRAAASTADGRMTVGWAEVFPLGSVERATLDRYLYVAIG